MPAGQGYGAGVGRRVQAVGPTPGQDVPEVPSQPRPGPEIEVPRRDEPELPDPGRQTQQPEVSPPEPDRPQHPIQPPAPRA